MKQTQILFKPEMVGATREGRKWQTRRKTGLDQVNEHPNRYVLQRVDAADGTAQFMDTDSGDIISIKCYYGGTGDHLWMKRTDFTKRTESPATLEMTGLRCERLQSISESDAIAEGFGPSLIPTATQQFAAYYCFNISKDTWVANPWVWVIEYKLLNQ